MESVNNFTKQILFIMAGKKQVWSERTVIVPFRVPESKREEFRRLGNEILDKWKTKREK